MVIDGVGSRNLRVCYRKFAHLHGSMFYLLDMVIFHSYVNLPEGN